MKKNTSTLIIIVIIIVIAAIIFVGNRSKTEAPAESVPDTTVANIEEQQVRDAVNVFAAHLQNVSLTASADVLTTTIQKEYGPFVTPELLTHWIADPTSAPGRLTSSPWPDHIDITSVQKVGSDYQVAGEVVLMTSNEVAHGGDAGRIPVQMTMTAIDGQWYVSDYQAAKE
jgi:hypothetical protein